MCLEKDVCDQLCVHINGSLACDCIQGYNMNPATRECEAEGEKQMVCVCVCMFVRVAAESQTIWGLFDDLMFAQNILKNWLCSVREFRVCMW